jgi:hypothetical protein
MEAERTKDGDVLLPPSFCPFRGVKILLVLV